MSILTKQVREGVYYENGIQHLYKCRILAVGKRLENGELVCPALEFFREQHSVRPDRLEDLTALIEYTARHGPPSNREKFKPVEGSELFEFKEFQYRLICFWDTNWTLICANGCVKKTNRLPRQVIETAEDWRRAYFEAKTRNTLIHEPEH